MLDNATLFSVRAAVAAGVTNALAQFTLSVVPNGFDTVEGNGGLVQPFGIDGTNSSIRYQQVYSASQFSAEPSGGWVFEIDFRVDIEAGFTFSPTTIPRLEIHLSTTPNAPNGLSSFFTNNVGADDTIMLTGPVTVGPGERDLSFDISIPLTNSFFYEPKRGNLLLEVRNYEGWAPGSPIPPFDAQFDAQSADTVACVYAYPATANSGSTIPEGLITRFWFAPTPSLRISTINSGTTTNYVNIDWSMIPPGFVLQRSSVLGSNALWEIVPNSAGTNPYFHRYSIQPKSPEFYRLTYPPVQ